MEMNTIPEHIAIIMDGNGRWATSRNLPRLAGHKAGVEALRKIIEHGANLGVKHMTFYAFSTENWKRPVDEVNGLMRLLVMYLKSETKKLHENNIKVNVIGDTSALPDKAQKELAKTIDITKNNTAMTVHMALNYGSRYEILQAVKEIAHDISDGKMTVDAIDEDHFSQRLYTAGVPDPDLMIRTSGEQRLSNYLLWQLAYAEFYFTDTYWPDFDDKALDRAIEVYQNRHRRFGKL